MVAEEGEAEDNDDADDDDDGNDHHHHHHETTVGIIVVTLATACSAPRSNLSSSLAFVATHDDQTVSYVDSAR